MIKFIILCSLAIPATIFIILTITAINNYEEDCKNASAKDALFNKNMIKVVAGLALLDIIGIILFYSNY